MPPRSLVADHGERQDDEGKDRYEVGNQLMMLPIPTLAPVDGGAGPATGAKAPAVLAAPDACDVPLEIHKVTAGQFEGGKTLDDYYPELVGTGSWGASGAAGPFDTGTRAGSAVQLVGTYPAPCAAGGSAFTFGQTATILRARADGKKMTENGKDFEGQTFDDIKRSRRDQSKPPFRQTFGFAVSMADPISGIPYKTLKSYEFHVDLTTSLSGPAGSKSVAWAVRIEASAGKVTKNDLV
jgi:hypothetical protein